MIELIFFSLRNVSEKSDNFSAVTCSHRTFSMNFGVMMDQIAACLERMTW